MAGLREFVVQFGAEEQCIEHLAGLRWPGGFACAGCGGRQAWRLKARPRVYECAACHRQESATAGTVLHRTRTDLTKWFLAAYLMGRDKRGVSGKFLQRELGVAYQTAWTMAHKLRHGLSEDPSRRLHGFLEADETFIGGRGDPTSRGRSTANPAKAWSWAPSKRCRRRRTRAESMGTPSSASTGFSLAVPASPCCRPRPGPKLGAFLKANVAANSHLLTDGFAGYHGADLGEYLKHTPVVQDDSANAGQFFPIIHTLFSNIKAWLVGTHHGVSAKHLPRYLREWSYRFNRRNLPDGLDRYLIRRAVECATITYDQLTAGAMPAGAARVHRPPATVGQPALAG